MELKDTKLFKLLQNLEEKEFGEKLYPISGNITTHLLPVSEKLLASIPAYMPEFTLHDKNHCIKIIEIIGDLLPPEVDLNIIELMILVHSVFLHDIGMVVNKDDALAMKATKDFQKLYYEYDKATPDDEILTEFIRRTHVTRSLEYVDKFKKSIDIYGIKFDFRGIDVSDWIKEVIYSHSIPASKLLDKEKYPLNKVIGKYEINVQYLSVLLRLGDILDFDIYRTPYFLYKHINPKNKISEEEWKKHLSVEGHIVSSNIIKISAKCSNSKIHRSVNNFISWIEDERKDSMDILKNNIGSKYILKLNDPVEHDIRTDGSYYYSDLAITLDFDKVIKILMGTELYDSPDIFIRELIQNSVDTCNFRETITSEIKQPYDPKIKITFNSKDGLLEIEDNGMGMNEDIFREYVIKIGKSYYQSKKFIVENKGRLQPISNFGIGILSCFMVSDTIEIESLSYGTDAEVKKPIFFTLNFKDTYVEQKKPNIKFAGTVIRLKLREEYLKTFKMKRVSEIVKENMLIQTFPIHILEDNESVILNQNTISLPEAIKNIESVEIIELNSCIDISGYIILFEKEYQTILNKYNVISQQNFKISGKHGNTPRLIPTWIETAFPYINIFGEKKLALKASRNNFNENENFYYIKNTITSFIIKHFQLKRNKSNPKEYINYLAKYMNLGNTAQYELFSEEEHLFLMNNVPAAVYNTEDKTTSVMSCAQIKDGIKPKASICLINNDLFTSNIANPKFLSFISKYKFVILRDGFIGNIIHLLSPYIVKNEILVTNMAGIVVDHLELDASTEYNWRNYHGTKETKSIWPCMIAQNISTEANASIFCAISNNHNNGIWLEINQNHPFGNLLIRTNDNLFTKTLLNSFFGAINNAVLSKYKQNKNLVLNTFVEHITGINFYQFIPNFFPITNYSKNIISISFIKSFNEYVTNNYLPNLSKDLLKEFNYIHKELTEKDFPNWWLR